MPSPLLRTVLCALVVGLVGCASPDGGGDTAAFDLVAEPLAAEDAPVAEVDLNGVWIDLDGRKYEIHQNGDLLWVRLHRVTSGLGHFVGPRGITVGFPGACCAGMLPADDDDTIYWSNATQWVRD